MTRPHTHIKTLEEKASNYTQPKSEYELPNTQIHANKELEELLIEIANTIGNQKYSRHDQQRMTILYDTIREQYPITQIGAINRADTHRKNYPPKPLYLYTQYKGRK